MKDHLIFDVTDADTIADTDSVGAFLRAGTDGDLISSGDGDSDDVANTFEGIDSRSFLFGYDGTGDNWDRLRQTAGALHVDIQDTEIDVVINAEKNEDDPHSSGDIGNYVLAVRSDSRPTDSNTSADGDYASFFINDSGEQYVIDTDGNALLTTIDAVLDSIKLDTAAMVVDLAAIEVEQLAQGVTLDAILVDTGTIAGDTTSIDATLTALSKAEDSVHSSGDQGIMSLAVRNDAGTPLAADGDYIPFTTDSTGALRVSGAGEDVALADTAIANAANPLSAANVAEDVVVSPLADRKYLFIYNNGNRKAYVGASGVSASDGFPVSPGSYLEMRAGDSVDIEWVSANTSQEIRTLELS